MFSPATPMTSVSGVWAVTGSSPLPQKSPATDGGGLGSARGGGLGNISQPHCEFLGNLRRFCFQISSLECVGGGGSDGAPGHRGAGDGS